MKAITVIGCLLFLEIFGPVPMRFGDQPYFAPALDREIEINFHENWQSDTLPKKRNVQGAWGGNNVIKLVNGKRQRNLL